jgi:antibiotic biosynthesis monooxygenase (ABM) superfamily enzyme
MDIKKKRIKLIKWTLAIAIFLPAWLFPFTHPKGGEPLYIVRLFFFIPSLVTKLLISIKLPAVMVIMSFAITHVLTYFLIGWIIARLIYPNKKISDKAETPQD